jgi:hypothetical protein
MRPIQKAILASTAALGLAGAALAEEKGAPLPRDYRTWTHVRSMVVTDPDHGMYGFQDVYANKAALETLRGKSKGAAFKDGAVLVAAIYEPVARDGMVKAGDKRRTAVRVKDARATATGGWRYAVYDPAGKEVQIDAATCVGCHQAAKDTDFVFARFVD